MFYGEYLHVLDEKNRIIIPSRFRKNIKDEGIDKFYITRGLDECLFMFSETDWKVYEKKFKEMSFTKKEVRRFNRLFFSGAIDVVPDKQWRILLPDYLKEYAQLNKNIVFVGVSNRIELWDKDKWNSFYDESKQSYEQIAEEIIDI